MKRKVLLAKKKSEEAKTEAIVPSQFGLGIHEDTKSDSDVVTNNVEDIPVNVSLGFSDSFIVNYLDDAADSDVNISAITVSGVSVSSPQVSGRNNKTNYSEIDATEDMVAVDSELNISAISVPGLSVNSPNVSGRRSGNKNNKRNYSELDTTEDMVTVDSDDDKDYTPGHEPKSKKLLLEESVDAEKPLKRRPGRPKGSTNRPKNSRKGKGLKDPVLGRPQKPFVSRPKKKQKKP